MANEFYPSSSSRFSAFLSMYSNQLPALYFLYHKNVEPEDLPRYFELLGTLYELFLTPHEIVVPPYRNCSYLKKYEQVQKLHYLHMIRHMVTIFEIDTSDVSVVTKLFQVTGTSSTDLTLPDDLLTVLREWLDFSFEDEIVMPIYFFEHIVFFALKKVKVAGVETLLLTFIDSWGYGELSSASSLALQTQGTIRTLLKQFVTENSTYVVKEMLPECPTLQMPHQGGNCAQWMLFCFAIFLNMPNITSEFFTRMGENPLFKTVNIQLFSLAMFLRTMPFYGLQMYYDAVVDYKNTIKYCIEEDDDVRSQVALFLGLPDCASQLDCSAPCVACSPSVGKKFPGTPDCYFPASVAVQEDTCRALTGKQIGAKMFYIFKQLRDIAGRDPFEMSQDQIDAQLSFVEPRTEQEYIERYKLTRDNMIMRRISYSARLHAMNDL